MTARFAPRPSFKVGLRRSRCALPNILAYAAAALLAWSSVSDAQTAPTAPQAGPTPREQSAPAANTVPASDGLAELGGMTFGCAKASLNAAAREAAKIPSQGTYQFAYFKIITDTHH